MTDGSDRPGPKKQFALTLDLENDWYFDDPGYDHLTFEYIEEFIDLIERLSVPLTVFVVGTTLEDHPEAVDRLATELDAEFHLHSYRHEPTRNPFREELRRGKAAFNDHFGHDPVGYREPYGGIDPEQFPVLADEGFAFDSSVFPSYRPGVYNNLDVPLEPYVPDGVDLLEIPLGVFRGLRIPLSQNYLKLFGRPLVELLSVAPLPRTVVYNIHLQDLFRTASHGKLPRIKRRIINRNLDESVNILEASVERIRSKGYEPVTLTDIHDRYRTLE
jgi:peptidoglycan/xylan/chitin deacetylase (PgdA/CDA1 family)